MKILIDIGHPAHVHLFRNLYHSLKDSGNEVFVTTQNIKIVDELLQFYKIEYSVVGKKKKGILNKGLSVIQRTLSLSLFIFKNNIDICIGSTPSVVQAAFLNRIPSVFMDDDDDPIEDFIVKIAHPFASVILSPKETLRKSKKTIYYDGYHELAYLHPNWFKTERKPVQITSKPYFILRFVALSGHHDIGKLGINYEQKLNLIKILENYGEIFITSEKSLEQDLEKYKYPVRPENMHEFLLNASLFIGDSQTMTSEAAVLGIPSFRCNSFVGKITYLEDEEKNYGLTFGFTPDKFDDMLEKINGLLKNKDYLIDFQEKRSVLLSEKIDVTSFLKWFILNYPKSTAVLKENPSYQYNFK